MTDEYLHSKLTASIDALSLSSRAAHTLRQNGIQTIIDLLSLQRSDLLGMSNFGPSIMTELVSVTRVYLSPLIQKYSKAEIGKAIRATKLIKSSSVSRASFSEAGQIQVLPSDSIETLPLSIRARNALMRSGIKTIADLLNTSYTEIKNIKNIGTKSLEEIQAIREKSLGLSDQLIYQENQLISFESPPVALLETNFLPLNHVLTKQKPQINDNIPALPKSTLNKLLNSGINNLDDLRQFTFEDLVTRSMLSYVEAKQVDESLRTVGILLSSRWPSHSLVHPSDYQFLKKAGIPLDKIGVSRLALPVDLEEHLKLLKIETVDILAVQSSIVLKKALGRYGDEYVSILTKSLRSYFVWLPTQSNWDNEINAQNISPLYFIWFKETTLEKIIDDLLNHLAYERSRKIIRLRFGLDGGGQRTLEQVGEQLDLTRERIRQIAKKSLDKLKQVTLDGLVHALLFLIVDEMKTRGGLMSVPQIGEYITDLMEIGELDLKATIPFLLSLKQDQLVQVQGDKWGLKDAPVNLIKLINKQLLEILRAVGAPLDQSDLIERFLQSKLYSEKKLQHLVSEKFIVACLSTDDRFEKVDDHQWRLTRWQKQRVDEIVMALRKLGKPSHFTEIAKVANEMLPPTQRASARVYHSQLSNKPHLFVWVNSGTFGLAEWGLKRARFYVDIAEGLLQERGEPLTFDEIFSRVNAEREASPESIKFMLGINPRFQQYPDNKYGLASWAEKPGDEDDDTDDPFLDDLTQRLFNDLFDKKES